MGKARVARSPRNARHRHDLKHERRRLVRRLVTHAWTSHDYLHRISGEAALASLRSWSLGAPLSANMDETVTPTGRHWAMTCVREMVFREMYRGRLIYGKTRWEYRRGRKFKVRTPESDWIVTEAPALRIVDEALWRASRAPGPDAANLPPQRRRQAVGAAGGRHRGAPPAHGVRHLRNLRRRHARDQADQ
jgi:recombinase